MSKNLVICDWNYITCNLISVCKKINLSNIVKPDIVVGIARGGAILATLISEIMRKDVAFISFSRRIDDIEIYEEPKLKYSFEKQLVLNKNVLLVDEIIATGKTMIFSKNHLYEMGARRVYTFSFANRSNGIYETDYNCIETCRNNVIFPWDYLVLDENNQVIVHPEYREMSENLEVNLFEKKQ